ncbi:conjugal transfer nickase/helicase domain-containing protein, partial [Pseudomonas viridiflava]
SQRADQDTEKWRWVQRQFEKLKIHRKRGDGLNIWICQVEGPRKKAKLKGYLLENPAPLFETVPADNPFLKVEIA